MEESARMLSRISDAELTRRWRSVREEMRARNLDALIMQSSNDWLGGTVKWFTDVPATNGYPRTVLFFADGGMVCVEMGIFDGVQALGGLHTLHRGVDEILTTPAFTSVCYTHAYDAVLAAGAMRRRGCRNIGVVAPGTLPSAMMDMVRAGWADAGGVQDATDWIDAIKAVKSPEEQAMIRAVARLQDAVFADVLAAVRPGLRDLDVAALAQQSGQVRGSEQGIFLLGSSPVGRAAVFLPRFLQGRTLKEGDHFSLLIEINGAGGFYTEIARTIVLGQAPALLSETFAALCAAQDHTLSLLVPGARCSEIAAAHDRYMVSHAMPPELRLYSHGQGTDMVERPLIRHDETMALQAGMCLAVHPGLTTPEMFAVVCDNYLVEADGASACLHATPKQIFEV